MTSEERKQNLFSDWGPIYPGRQFVPINNKPATLLRVAFSAFSYYGYDFRNKKPTLVEMMEAAEAICNRWPGTFWALHNAVNLMSKYYGIEGNP